MAFRIGDRVNDLVLVRPDGSPITLGSFGGRPLLVIFVRHLA
jgi:hypothetical protein